MNASSEMAQPADTDGKYPHRCPRANLEDPSIRNTAVAIYLLA